ALRSRGSADDLPRRASAAVAPSIPDGDGHDRTPHAAACALASAPPPPARRARADGAGAGRLDARRLPPSPAHDGRRARRLRRGLPALRRGHRSPVPRRESRLGALVRAGGGRAPRAPGGDGQAVSDAAHALALGRNFPLRAQAPREVESAVNDVLAKFDRIAAGYAEHDYADPARYAARRAAVIVSLGPRLEPGESVLDLGCGDGIMARPLTAFGLRYRGVDASAGMVDAARVRNPGLPFDVARSEDYEPTEPVDATICLRSFYY